jgi:hypothetical protein
MELRRRQRSTTPWSTHVGDGAVILRSFHESHLDRRCVVSNDRPCVPQHQARAIAGLTGKSPQALEIFRSHKDPEPGGGRERRKKSGLQPGTCNKTMALVLPP